MALEDKEVIRKMSIKQLFAIFLKTGKKRIALSIISGALVFLTITSLIMVVYTHRFNEFQEYETIYHDWYNDDIISVSTNFIHRESIIAENDTFNQFVNEFRSMVKNYVPDIKTENFTAAISTEVYTLDPHMPVEPWINHEYMAVDNMTYQVIADNVVEGRLPQNRTELLCFKRDYCDISLNDTITIYTITESNSPRTNYTVVGLIDENIRTILQNANHSSDIVDWSFDGIPFYNYPAYNTFFMNYNKFQEIFNYTTAFNGVITYLVDISYDTSELQLNKIASFASNFPDENNRPISEILDYEVIVAPDLFNMLSDFTNLWVFKTARILSINSPLIFLVGLLLVISLTIGSKGLEISFRRMKLYGLSYNIIRRLLIFENLIFTFVSFLIGTFVGFGTSVLLSFNLENRPSNYYRGFITEPLLYISLIAFTVGFFLLSFFIQNSITKRTAKTTPEEFQLKRRKVRAIFSTNEFRMFVIGLLFTIFSISFYSIYRFWGTRFVYTTTFTYFTFMWFMISCSFAFLITFLFLLLARLITFLWTVIGQRLWKNNLNLFSLTIRHISVNRVNYQLAILGALIFGLVIIPGFAIDKSISHQIQNEAELRMGSTTIVIPHWVDPFDEFDYLLANISEIDSFTEVSVYVLQDDNLDQAFPKAFQVTLIGLEDPRNFTRIIDTTLINESKISLENIIALENDSNILIEQKHARKQNVKPGDFYQTTHFTRLNNNLSLINTYEYFPLAPLSKKPIFTSYLDVFALVASRSTIRDIAGSIYFDTDISTESMKLIKPVNESDVPIIKQKIADLNYTTVSYDEIYEYLYLFVNDFAKNNLQFFAFLSSLALIFIGFYTGVSIFEERGRIMDSFYRSGAIRRQILGFFTLEIILINGIPILLTMIASLPLIRFITSYYLGLQSNYYPYRSGIPWWIIILLFLAGLALSLLGWLIALTPAIYRYKPVKQE